MICILHICFLIQEPVVELVQLQQYCSQSLERSWHWLAEMKRIWREQQSSVKKNSPLTRSIFSSTKFLLLHSQTIASIKWERSKLVTTSDISGYLDNSLKLNNFNKLMNMTFQFHLFNLLYFSLILYVSSLQLQFFSLNFMNLINYGNFKYTLSSIISHYTTKHFYSLQRFNRHWRL